MLKKNIILSLIILLVGLLAAFQITRFETSQAAGDEHGHEHGEEHEEAPTPRGPHRGRMFTDKDLTAEIQIYETEIPPEFHVYFYRDGKAVPVSEVKFKADVIRLGQTDKISFRQEKDYLLSEQTIYEPHSFEAVFYGEYRGQKYQWSFSQEEGRLQIPPDLLKRSEIKILKAGPQAIHSKLSFPGQIAMDQDKFVHVVPTLAGSAVEVHKHVGERVKKGEVMAVIHSRELADLRLELNLAQKRLLRAQGLDQKQNTIYQRTRQLIKLLQQGQDPENIHRQMLQSPLGNNKDRLISSFTELRLARQHLKREQQLMQDKITSQESLQQAQSHYERALSVYIAALEEALLQSSSEQILKNQDLQMVQAEVEGITQKLKALKVPLKYNPTAMATYSLVAPISGVITEKHLAVGEFVQADKEIFVVANLSEVWAELLVPDAQLEKVRLGQHVKVISQNGQRQAFGVISHNSPVVDAGTRRAEAHAHIDNLDGFWRPGMFVTVEVTTDERTVPIAVAKSALQSYNDWTVVYAKFGDMYEIRPLELGQESAEWVEVKEGLKAGQEYAATNSFIIKAEIGKKAATHDH